MRLLSVLAGEIRAQWGLPAVVAVREIGKFNFGNYEMKLRFLLGLIFTGCFLINCGVSNYTISGVAFYKNNHIRCTKMACNCCNKCKSNLLFISGTDTFQLCGQISDTSRNCGFLKYKDSITCDTIIRKLKDVPLICMGKECKELNCFPYHNGSRYEFYGHFLRKYKKNPYKYFLVLKSSQLQ